MNCPSVFSPHLKHLDAIMSHVLGVLDQSGALGTLESRVCEKARDKEPPERSLAPRRRYSSKLGHDDLDALADRGGCKPPRQASGKRIRTRTRRGEEHFQGASTGTVAIIWKMPLSVHLETATENPQRLLRCRFWVCNLSPPQASGLESRHPEAPPVARRPGP